MVAEIFSEPTPTYWRAKMKPKHLEKLEEYYQDSARVVLFDNRFGGEWMVDIRGHFADFEIDEINRALKSVNKAGKL